MLHLFKRNLFIFSLVLFVLIAWIIVVNKNSFFSWKFIFGEEKKSQWWALVSDDFVEEFMAAMLTWEFASRRWLIIKYCDFLIKDNRYSNWFAKWAYRYEPKKSIFVYQLCTHVDQDYADKFDEIDEYLKSWYEIKPQWFVDKIIWSSQCDWSWDMNWCDFSILLSTLFKDLINEYSNIKIASMFWYSQWDSEKDIEEFSKLYFGENACNTTEYNYLSKENIEDDKNIHCSHPKTYKLLSDYINSIKNKISKTKFLKVEDIKDWYFYVWLLERNQKDFAWFKNILYNELMFYNVFLVYYTYALWVDMWLYPMEIWADSEQFFESKDTEVALARREALLSQRAIYNTQRLLANLYSAFPLHIWMMAYYEDLVNFRDKFKSIYTPFNQMYYKMQNVQDTRK